MGSFLGCDTLEFGSSANYFVVAMLSDNRVIKLLYSIGQPTSEELTFPLLHFGHNNNILITRISRESLIACIKWNAKGRLLFCPVQYNGINKRSAAVA